MKNQNLSNYQKNYFVPIKMGISWTLIGCIIAGVICAFKGKITWNLFLVSLFNSVSIGIIAGILFLALDFWLGLTKPQSMKRDSERLRELVILGFLIYLAFQITNATVEQNGVFFWELTGDI